MSLQLGWCWHVSIHKQLWTNLWKEKLFMNPSGCTIHSLGTRRSEPDTSSARHVQRDRAVFTVCALQVEYFSSLANPSCAGEGLLCWLSQKAPVRISKYRVSFLIFLVGKKSNHPMFIKNWIHWMNSLFISMTVVHRLTLKQLKHKKEQPPSWMFLQHKTR